MPSHAGAAALLLPTPPVVADGIALFLDMDGVLAPMAPTPDAVVPTARRTAALKAVEARLSGRVAIVSGRTIAEIDRISDHALVSGSGVHGLERRLKDGSIQRKTADAGVAEVMAAFEAFAGVHKMTAAAGRYRRLEWTCAHWRNLLPHHCHMRL